LGTEYFVHHRIVSAVMRVEFVSDKMSHAVLRGRWCNIAAVNSTMFLHRIIHKYTWTSPDGKTHNQIDHILIHKK
jgi:hypothetical protein